MRERLKAEPAPEIVKYLILPRIHDDVEINFAGLAKVNAAHAAMLVEQGILDRATGVRILQGLKAISDAGHAAIELDPAKEDLYFNVEGVLIDRIGADAGGRLHTGRSRNDLYATLHRMKVRADLFPVADAALRLQEKLYDVAEAEAETVMTGYTHLQPGQPITAGHYLSGIAGAFGRDIRRLLDSYPLLNLSPLGAGALATTGFPINRERTAELLGFDGLVENSLDCVASRDFINDALYAFSMMATTISRLGNDLHIWYSAEFGFIDIGDDMAGSSSIMPQKKNPTPIEHMKSKAGHLYGGLMAALSCQKTAPFTNGREAGNESYRTIYDGLKQIDALLALSHLVVRGLQFRTDNLLSHADRNYSTLTDLADMLVRHHDVSFRVAHKIVGTIAAEAHERRFSGARAITPEMVNDIASRIAERPIAFSAADLNAALDPKQNVERRAVTGGPASSSVRRMVANGREQVAADRALVARRRASLEAADKRLADTVAGLLA